MHQLTHSMLYPIICLQFVYGTCLDNAAAIPSASITHTPPPSPPQQLLLPAGMSSTSMDIAETFRPEDLSKTDFFDFVTAPDLGITIDRPPAAGSEGSTNGSAEQALQGYDQVSNSFILFTSRNKKCKNPINKINAISNQYVIK